ncbi:MAG: GTPase Era [Arsenophonus sp.]|nr:MAG: GTPase Era [Arsenophonus sp.]
MKEKETYCGFVSIIGKTNVGKSTLLNRLIGKKISITSSKSQTTLCNIVGILTKKNKQIIYIDTPGMKNKNFIFKKYHFFENKYFYKNSLIIFVIEEMIWDHNDERLLKSLRFSSCPILLVVNKIDKVSDKKYFLPYLSFLRKKMNFLNIILVSAKKNQFIGEINKLIFNLIPREKLFFSKEKITNSSKKFIISEIIREKTIRYLGDELPYLINIKIKNSIFNKEHFRISAFIYVNKKSQKKIIIGNQGKKIKKISMCSRIDIQKYFLIKSSLYLWVKINKKIKFKKF